MTVKTILPVRQIDVAPLVGRDDLSSQEELWLTVAGDDFILEDTDFFLLADETQEQLSFELNLEDRPFSSFHADDLLSRIQQKLVQDVLDREFPQLADWLAPLIFDFGPHLSIADLENLCHDLSRLKKADFSDSDVQGLVIFVTVARDAQALNRQIVSGGEAGILDSLEDDFEVVVDALLLGKIQIQSKNFPQDALSQTAAAIFRVNSDKSGPEATIFYRPELLSSKLPDLPLHEMIHAAQYLTNRFDMTHDVDRLAREREAYQAQWLFNLYSEGEQKMREETDASMAGYITDSAAQKTKKGNDVKRAFEILKSNNTVKARFNTINILAQFELIELSTQAPNLLSDSTAEWAIAKVHQDPNLAQREKDLDQSFMISENLSYFRSVANQAFLVVKDHFDKVIQDPKYQSILSLSDKEKFLKKSFVAYLGPIRAAVLKNDSFEGYQKKMISEIFDIYAQAIFGDMKVAIQKLNEITEALKTRMFFEY